MSVIFDVDERWGKLVELANKATHILISSYNLYAGMTKHGNLIVSSKTRPARELLNVLSEKGDKARVIISIPPLHCCKEECEDCKESHSLLIQRFKHHSNQWPGVNFRYRNDSHLKLFLFYIDGKWVGMTGGMNLSLSSWKDLLLPIPEESIPKVLEYYKDMWDSSSEDVDEFLHWSF